MYVWPGCIYKIVSYFGNLMQLLTFISIQVRFRLLMCQGSTSNILVLAIVCLPCVHLHGCT